VASYGMSGREQLNAQLVEQVNVQVREGFEVRFLSRVYGQGLGWCMMGRRGLVEPGLLWRRV